MPKFQTVRSLTFLFGSALLLLVLPACAVFFPGNPNSEKADAESVDVILTPNTASAGEDQILGAVAQIISLTVQEISTQLKAEAAKYSAQYSGSASGQFYHLQLPKTGTSGNRDLSTVKYILENKNIIITRKIMLSDETTNTTAATITADLMQDGDKSVFYLKADSADVEYAKAKVAASHKKVDITVQYTFSATYTGSDGKANSNSTIGTGKLVLAQTPIGSATNYPPDSGPRTEYIPCIPITPIPGALTGDQTWGNFTVTVVVSEVDNYGDKIDKINTTLTNNAPMITNFTSIAINLLTNNGTTATGTTTPKNK